MRLTSSLLPPPSSCIDCPWNFAMTCVRLTIINLHICSIIDLIEPSESLHVDVFAPAVDEHQMMSTIDGTLKYLQSGFNSFRT